MGKKCLFGVKKKEKLKKKNYKTPPPPNSRYDSKDFKLSHLCSIFVILICRKVKNSMAIILNRNRTKM